MATATNLDYTQWYELHALLLPANIVFILFFLHMWTSTGFILFHIDREKNVPIFLYVDLNNSSFIPIADLQPSENFGFLSKEERGDNRRWNSQMRYYQRAPKRTSVIDFFNSGSWLSYHRRPRFKLCPFAVWIKRSQHWLCIYELGSVHLQRFLYTRRELATTGEGYRRRKTRF